MSLAIDNNQLIHEYIFTYKKMIHESPGLKSDWLEEINSFSMKNS